MRWPCNRVVSVPCQGMCLWCYDDRRWYRGKTIALLLRACEVIPSRAVYLIGIGHTAVSKKDGVCGRHLVADAIAQAIHRAGLDPSGGPSIKGLRRSCYPSGSMGVRHISRYGLCGAWRL